MGLSNKFTEHPASVGETYWQHFAVATGFGFALFRAAFCCIVHAVLPFMFEKTGSTCISELHERMVTNRSRLKDKQTHDDQQTLDAKVA